MRCCRRLRARRTLASLLVGICFLLAMPPAALAQEDDESLWTQWWKGVTDRSIKAEIPFAFLVTLPAMIVITPVWLAERAYARLSAEDDDS